MLRVSVFLSSIFLQNMTMLVEDEITKLGPSTLESSVPLTNGRSLKVNASTRSRDELFISMISSPRINGCPFSTILSTTLNQKLFKFNPPNCPLKYSCLSLNSKAAPFFWYFSIFTGCAIFSSYISIRSLLMTSAWDGAAPLLRVVRAIFFIIGAAEAFSVVILMAIIGMAREFEADISLLGAAGLL